MNFDRADVPPADRCDCTVIPAAAVAESRVEIPCEFYLCIPIEFRLLMIIF